MKSKRHCIVMKDPPGYRHPPLNLTPLGVKEEEIALAVTIPPRNTIACLDVGYRAGTDVRFPWEETIHYITVLSMMDGVYPIVREGVTKMMRNDFSDTYLRLAETVPLVEAIADIREEYDPKYRTEMERYRSVVLDYFGTSDTSIFSRRADVERNIQTEKELLRQAADNIINLYEGPKEVGLQTCLLALTIYTASVFPDHRQFLESYAKIKKPWKSIIGKDDFFRSVINDLPEQIPCFPFDHFHFFVGHTVKLVHDVMEYYSTIDRKIVFLSSALPSMMSAIDFTMGFFYFFNFIIQPELSNTGRLECTAYCIPRMRQVYTEFSLIKSLLRYFEDRLECPLAKCYSWIADPSARADPGGPLDDVTSHIEGKTIASNMTGYYLDRYFLLLDLMVAFEEAVINKNHKCAFCQEVVQSFEKLHPKLIDALSDRYITNNYSRLWSVLESAASSLHILMPQYLENLSRKYLLDLQL